MTDESKTSTRASTVNRTKPSGEQQSNGHHALAGGDRLLDPGEVVSTEDIDWAVELEVQNREKTEQAKIVVYPKTRLSRESSVNQQIAAENPVDNRLILYLGHIKVRVLHGHYTIRTRSADIIGTEGSIFVVRAILDGTSEVKILQGDAEINWLINADGAENFHMIQGDEIRLRTNGTRTRL